MLSKLILMIHDKGAKILKFHRPAKAVLVTISMALTAIVMVVALTFSRTTTIETSGLNVRTGPGLDYATIGTVKKGQRVTILKTRNSWYKIRLSDQRFGWVASWLVHPKNNLKHVSSLSEATIVIDPGHGGSDSGAEYKNSTSKRYMEKTYTLQLANRVAQELRLRGAHVIMTRDSDRYVGLKPRPALAESMHADAFISFHFDSSPARNEASGFTTYYYHKGASKKLAKALNKQLNNLPLTNRGIEFGDFLVIRDNTRPAVLCEMGYINSTKDFNQIKNASYQQKIARDIAKGLNNYFKN